ALEELGTAHLRHALVRHDDGDVVLREQLEPARAALGREDVEVLAVVVAKGAQDVGLVVDDEHGKFVVVQRHGALSICPRLRRCQVTAPAGPARGCGPWSRPPAPSPGRWFPRARSPPGGGARGPGLCRRRRPWW